MERKSLRITVAVFLIWLAVGLTLTSCKKKAEVGKGSPAMTPEMTEAFRKSYEEANKITVATVNGVDIKMSDLIKEMNAVAPSYVKPGTQKDPEVDKKVQNEALENLIRNELSYQEAVKQGLKVPPEMTEAEVNKIRAGMRSEEAYRGYLATAGITETELRNAISRKLLIDMIRQQEIFGKVAVDPARVKKTYLDDKSSYKGPAGQMSFDEAAPLIEQKLMAQAAQKREEEWVKGLKKTARIAVTLEKWQGEIHGIY